MDLKDNHPLAGFKKWFEHGYGATGSDVAANEPRAFYIPHLVAQIDAQHGVGAWPRVDFEPLPGNKKPMNKKQKKK